MVKSFQEVISDISARTSPRKDINGNDCALVKVQIALDDVSFKDAIVGDVAHGVSEYEIYMPSGTKNITLYAKNYLPLRIVFNDYKIKQLESLKTYIAVIETPQKMINNNAVLKRVRFDVSPIDASVKIDNLDIALDKNGSLEIPLSQGMHKYKISAKYYKTQEGDIAIDEKQESYKLNYSMERIKALVSIDSNPSGASIFLDSKRIGSTPLKGYSVDAGEHQFTLSLGGYNDESIAMTIGDDTPRYINKVLEKQAKGEIYIQSNVTGAMIYLDGGYVGFSPYYGTVFPGEHTIHLSKTGYKDFYSKQNVIIGRTNVVNAKLKKEKIKKVYAARTHNFRGRNIKFDNSMIVGVGYSKAAQLTLNEVSIPGPTNLFSLESQWAGVYMGIDMGGSMGHVFSTDISTMCLKFGAGLAYNFDDDGDKAIVLTPYIGFRNWGFSVANDYYDGESYNKFLYGINVLYYKKYLALRAGISNQCINFVLGLRIWRGAY